MPIESLQRTAGKPAAELCRCARKDMMKKVIAYLILTVVVYSAAGLSLALDGIPLPHPLLRLAIYCGICGGIGGVTYCLRGVYLNVCVFKRWDETWLPWYFIRPIVSFICGVISCLFLKAGLIVLEAQQSATASNLAFYALAFVAGLNVDKFVEKVEDIAQVTWGIKKSRTAQKDEENA